MEQIRRDYVPEDEAFSYREESLGKLCQVQEDLLYLIGRGYPMKDTPVFTGNHYLLSEQRCLALVRATSSRQVTVLHGNREVIGPIPGKEVYMDGLSTIITLGIALSGSTFLKCIGDTIRDLVGLRGAYRTLRIRPCGAQRPGQRCFESKRRGRASLPPFARHINWLFLFTSVTG